MQSHIAVESLENRRLLSVSSFPKGIGTTGADLPADIASDRLSNVIVAGRTNVIGFEDSVNNSPSSSQNVDVVAKYAADGTLLWKREFTGADIAKVATDGENSIYFAGSFSGTVDFDPRRTTQTATSPGSGGAFVCKLSKNGNLLMIKNFGGKGLDLVNGLAVDNAGNMFIGGTFSGRANFDPNGDFSIGSGSGSDGYIVALNSAGNFRWAGSFGGGSGQQLTDLAVDDSGSVLATGVYLGTADFDPGHGTSSVNIASTGQAYIFKWNSSGAFVFADGIGGAGSTKSTAVTVDRDGNIYSTGIFSLTADFDPGAGTFNLTAPAEGKVYVSKLSASGALVWAKAMGGSSDYQFGPGEIAVDKAKNVYVNGTFSGTKDFDPSGAVSNLTSAGLNDIFVAKLNSTGNFVFAKAQGGAMDDSSESMVLDRAGNLLTTGRFRGTANFGTGSDILNVSSAGDSDIYVSKLNSNGILA